MRYLLLILIIFNGRISAQQFDLGSWNILNVKYTYNSKLSFFGETQLRSLKFYSNYHYYEYKGGVNYKFNNNLKFTIGLGSYQTYREGGNFVLPKNNDEFRVWPQLTLFQSIGAVNIEQRYRTELRFTSNGYRNRYRYRLGLVYPFGKDLNGYKPFQVSLSNELFFTDKEAYFERNRLLLALNYKFKKNTSLQLGYLHQFDYKINDEIGQDFLVLGIYLEFTKNSNSKNKEDFEINDNQ